MASRSQRADADVRRHHRIKAEQDAYIKSATTETLISEVWGRVMPVLTHERAPSTMSIPVDHARDDDVFVADRLLELQRRAKGVSFSEE